LVWTATILSSAATTLLSTETILLAAETILLAAATILLPATATKLWTKSTLSQCETKRMSQVSGAAAVWQSICIQFAAVDAAASSAADAECVSLSAASASEYL